MAKRYYRKLAALIKRETTYGTDAVPTGALNAIDLSDVTVEPLAGQEEPRDLLRPYLGQQGVLLTANYGTIEFSVELAGSGTAGTAPAYGPILRGCGLSEVVTAATSVVYAPVSSGAESVTAYFNMDGTNHIFAGARGNVSLELTPQRIPRLRFKLWGLLGTVSDIALPTSVYTAFRRAVEVSKANTTMTLHGWSSIAERLSIDLGNQVEPRFLIGDESIEIVDRKSSGTAVVEASQVAAVDWVARARARTRAALAVQHGMVAGNIVAIGAAAVELGRPTYGQTQGILNYTVPLMLCPTTGDDELSLTIR